MSWKRRSRWFWRTVKGGRIRLLGKDYTPRADVVHNVKDGERLLFYVYPDLLLGYPRTVANPCEWTAPTDPDGRIRRLFWEAL